MELTELQKAIMAAPKGTEFAVHVVDFKGYVDITRQEAVRFAERAARQKMEVPHHISLCTFWIGGA